MGVSFGRQMGRNASGTLAGTAVTLGLCLLPDWHRIYVSSSRKNVWLKAHSSSGNKKFACTLNYFAAT